MALIDNLISYYKFDENAANTTVTDSHGSNTGTASTNTSNLFNASGRINSAFDFDGSSEYVTGIYDIDGSSSFSLSAWINLDDITSTQSIYGTTIGGVGATFELFVTGSNLDINIRNNAGSLSQHTGTTILSTGTWYHVVVIYDSSGQTMKTYINNSIDINDSYTLGSWSNTANPTIASFDSINRRHYLNGRVDEVGIFSTNISVSDVSDLYNSGNGLAYPFSAPSGYPNKVLGIIGGKVNGVETGNIAKINGV